MTHADHDDELLSASQIAAELGITASTWRSWVARGVPKGNPAPRPDAVLDGRTPRTRRSTFEAWKSARTGPGVRTDLQRADPPVSSDDEIN